jgi:anti-sigma factor RsiW
MNDRCSITLLEAALAGNLRAEDEDPFHRHLESCEACSAALEKMAGGSQWCREATAGRRQDV